MHFSRALLRTMHLICTCTQFPTLRSSLSLSTPVVESWKACLLSLYMHSLSANHSCASFNICLKFIQRKNNWNRYERVRECVCVSGAHLNEWTSKQTTVLNLMFIQCVLICAWNELMKIIQRNACFECYKYLFRTAWQYNCIHRWARQKWMREWVREVQRCRCIINFFSNVFEMKIPFQINAADTQTKYRRMMACHSTYEGEVCRSSSHQ